MAQFKLQLARSEIGMVDTQAKEGVPSSSINPSSNDLRVANSLQIGVQHPVIKAELQPYSVYPIQLAPLAASWRRDLLMAPSLESLKRKHVLIYLFRSSPAVLVLLCEHASETHYLLGGTVLPSKGDGSTWRKSMTVDARFVKTAHLLRFLILDELCVAPSEVAHIFDHLLEEFMIIQVIPFDGRPTFPAIPVSVNLWKLLSQDVAVTLALRVTATWIAVF
ncbi:hypothetical protein BGW80DRAFT_1448368 [Lactifluus volemus]|nr:hypothetical protein BGW80DRAFT_1448368 [Lactifluus volemus]